MYINASENRKESFFKLQRINLVKKQKLQEVLTLSIKNQKKIRRARSLKFFQDVVFRWNFTCHMLIRAHDLRFEITQFCVKWDVDYLLLKKKEWSQIEYFIELLKSFCLFIKILSTTRTIIINIVFKIYNRLFEHLKRAKSRLARKRVTWKKSLIDAFKTIETKLIKYYSQTQNDLELLYDKTILLHLTVDDTLFQITKWKVEFEETSWHTIYWNALEEMYNEYKRDNVELKS